MRSLIACTVVLLSAAVAQAQIADPQFLDCSGGCTTTVYGLGSDPNFDGGTTDPDIHMGSKNVNRTGRQPTGACSGEDHFTFPGQFYMAEMDDCVVSSTNTCMVEMQEVPLVKPAPIQVMTAVRQTTPSVWFDNNS